MHWYSSMILLGKRYNTYLLEGMITVTEEKIEIRCDRDIVQTRQKAREMARKSGFSSASQTRLATAILELMRNIIHYSDKWVCTMNTESDKEIEKVIVTIKGQGSKIPDTAKAKTFGFTTKKNGLEIGLSNVKRLVSEFYIELKPDYKEFTIVMFQKK
jgi:serine/threonine-protein kinase RsbT